ncbi:MAG: hypothetical protein NZM44_02035 [Candidatus Calescibacterium sp.]|nr:hypothetical protein [Candidatus Calescibacterium sp.]
MYEVKISEKIDLILESKLDDVPIRLSIQIVLPYVNPMSRLKEHMSRLKEHTTKDGKKYLFTWNGFSVSLSSDPLDE